MDALSDLLRVVRFSGSLFLEAKFRGPWCVSSQLSPENCGPAFKSVGGPISFHYILDGHLKVRTGNEQIRTAGPGDMILVARNDPHLLGSDLTLPPVPSTSLIRKVGEHAMAEIDHGAGEKIDQHFVCGFLAAPVREHPLLSALPPLLVASVRGRPCAEWAESSFRYAARECAACRPGSQEILSRLAELLFVEAVRGYIEQLSGDATGWLAALRDPSLARALAALHARPMHPWTAEGLAEEASLSRSAFAERFTATVGQPPMSYLTRWRMLVAGQRLRESSDTIAQIAETVGYESESTFSRAFAREMGVAPGAWRAGRTRRERAGGRASTKKGARALNP
jgi:AraC-like DNA-binding protein